MPLKYFGKNDLTDMGRILETKGTDVASANDMTLTTGNFFKITGGVQINRIASAGWTAGSHIMLSFAVNLTVKHNQLAGGGFATILVESGGAATDYSPSVGSLCELFYDGTNFLLHPYYTA